MKNLCYYIQFTSLELAVSDYELKANPEKFGKQLKSYLSNMQSERILQICIKHYMAKADR